MAVGREAAAVPTAAGVGPSAASQNCASMLRVLLQTPLRQCSKCLRNGLAEQNLRQLLLLCLTFVSEILRVVFIPRKLVLVAQIDFSGFVISGQR